MALSDSFNNTPPATITPSRGSAFNNTAPAGASIGFAAAFSNTSPTAATFSRGAVFDNTKPGVFYTGDERYFAVCAPSGNQNLNQLVAGHTVAGVTLADGDIVLVTGSTQAQNNGIFLVNGAGATAIRAHPMTTPFSVRVGPNSTTNANKVFAYFPEPNFVLETTHVHFIETTATAHPI
mgnify:CR=1 FL=1